MQCPICKHPTLRDPIAVNSGDPILCRECQTIYHRCRDGVIRTGSSPLRCSHCNYRKEHNVDFLGDFEVNRR